MDAEQNSSKKRGLTWVTGPGALLSTWRRKIQQKHRVFSSIKEQWVREYLRTARNVDREIKALKRNYFNAKNSNKLSGNGRTTCRYYDELEDILGGRPAVTSPKVKDSSENHSSRKNSVIFRRFFVSMTKERTVPWRFSVSFVVTDPVYKMLRMRVYFVEGKNLSKSILFRV
ncbi:unnamed protein product [Mytilus edulis]|uniref:Uncharacterized protein n=1 Tax=Mytilus edulis TaxID=6550 RepID=A0A8S3RUA4_MYTED|nr:unnamed protein product [Mytilus edulis]